jgi:hypothetical protein
MRVYRLRCSFLFVIVLLLSTINTNAEEIIFPPELLWWINEVIINILKNHGGNPYVDIGDNKLPNPPYSGHSKDFEIKY